MAVTATSVQDRIAGRTLIHARTAVASISLIWADWVYTGTLPGFAATLGITIQIEARLSGQIGFHVPPAAGSSDCTLAWISRCRRTVRDHERRRPHDAAFVEYA